MYNLLIVINSGLILYCCGWFTSFTFFLVWLVFSGGWLQRLITASEDSVDPAKTQDKVPCTYWQPWITGSWELSLTNSRFFCLYRYSKQSNELFRKKFRNCKYKLNNYQLIAKKSHKSAYPNLLTNNGTSLWNYLQGSPNNGFRSRRDIHKFDFKWNNTATQF